MGVYIARRGATCQNAFPDWGNVSEMTRISILLVALAASAGCTTYKLWTEYGENPDQGTLQLSYEYRKYENPQVDERAGIERARERCRDWGWKDAQRKGEDRQCKDGTESDCSKWLVIREYRCLREAAR
jgi:hypothetical protein